MFLFPGCDHETNWARRSAWQCLWEGEAIRYTQGIGFHLQKEIQEQVDASYVMASNGFFIFKGCLRVWLPGNQCSEPFPYRDRYEIHMFDMLSGNSWRYSYNSFSSLASTQNKTIQCRNTGESDVVFVFVCFKKRSTSRSVPVNCGW